MALVELIEEPGADGAPPPPPSSGANLAYAGASRVHTTGDSAAVELFGNLNRTQVRFEGTIKNPLRFREALSALYGVIGSDYRYAPKDRTQYIAYLRLKRDVAPLGVWHAQQAYFEWMLRNDPTALTILDPVVSLHPDQLTFEVFGKDESTYACLAFARDAFAPHDGSAYGTTNIDFSDALYASVQSGTTVPSRRLKRARKNSKRRSRCPIHGSAVSSKCNRQQHCRSIMCNCRRWIFTTCCVTCG